MLARSRRLTIGLTLGALLVGALLLLCDAVPRFATTHAHASVSGLPLILIGLAWLTLHPGISVHPIEFIKRLIAAVAFVLWGIDQTLPPGWLAAVVGDMVIVLFVVDMALIIKGELRPAP